MLCRKIYLEAKLYYGYKKYFNAFREWTLYNLISKNVFKCMKLLGIINHLN